MMVLTPHCGPYIPRVLWYDDDARVLAVGFLPHPHNKHIKDANERVVLTEPFDAACPNNCVIQDEQLAGLVADLRSDPVALRALGELVTKYRRQKDGLIHNDLHTGNLLATHSTLYCIDWEFATMGPAAFDVGCVLGCLVLAFVTLDWARRTHGSSSGSSSGSGSSGVDHAVQPQAPHVASPAEQRVWLLGVMERFWTQFSVKYSELVVEGGGQVDMDLFFRDAVGYAGLCMIRLTIGMHAYPGYSLDVAQNDLPAAQAQVLRVGRTLLQMRSQPKCSIGSFLAAVQSCKV